MKEIGLNHPTYGARRVAAMLRRELNVPINRKRVGRIFHALNWIEPSKKKSEIIKSAARLVVATRPYELWETDLRTSGAAWTDGATFSTWRTSSKGNGPDTHSIPQL